MTDITGYTSIGDPEIPEVLYVSLKAEKYSEVLALSILTQSIPPADIDVKIFTDATMGSSPVTLTGRTIESSEKFLVQISEMTEWQFRGEEVKVGDIVVINVFEDNSSAIVDVLRPN